ncbi:hypothetical protein [Sorangium sp. So ce1000]
MASRGLEDHQHGAGVTDRVEDSQVPFGVFADTQGLPIHLD